MSTLLAVVMQSRSVAQAIALTLEVVSDIPLDVGFVSYDERPPPTLMLNAHLFLFDVFSRDALGPRASGVLMAERWASAGHRVLLVSGHAVAERIASPYYWDVAASDHLPERVSRLLALPPPMERDFADARHFFSVFIRPPHDGHHNGRARA